MFSPMTVPFTPQIALVADSLLENLQQIIFFFYLLPLSPTPCSILKFYNNQALNKQNFLLNFKKKKIFLFFIILSCNHILLYRLLGQREMLTTSSF